MSVIYPFQRASRHPLPGINMSRVDLILLDFDGVFYPETLEHAEKANAGIAHGMTMLLIKHRPELEDRVDAQELKGIAQKAYPKKSVLQAMKSYIAKEYGVGNESRPIPNKDRRFLQQKMNQYFIDHAKEYPGHLSLDPGTLEAITALSVHKKLVIMTHASKEWVHYLFERDAPYALRHHIKIYGFEDFNFHGKGLSSLGYKMIAEREGVRLPRCLLIDNTMDNVVNARQCGLQAGHIVNDPRLKSFNNASGHVRFPKPPSYQNLKHLVQSL